MLVTSWGAFNGTPKPKQVLVPYIRCAQIRRRLHETPCRRLLGGRLIEIHDDGLLFRELADGVLGAFFAHAAVLDAAVWHVVHAEARAVVDDDAACFNVLGCVVGDVERRREDAGLQAVTKGMIEKTGANVSFLTTSMSGVTSVRMVGS